MLKSFKDYLSSSNIDIIKEDQTGISFEYGGFKYLFVVDENDPFYFRLILPNVLSINTGVQSVIYGVINVINKNYKAVKVFVNDDANIWISVEEFIHSKENIYDLFKRIIELLKIVIADFKAKINENH